MSKLLFVAYKEANNDVIIKDKEFFNIVESRIIPDNITPNKIKILETENSLCAIFNPVSTIPIIGSSICLGYSPDTTWPEFDKRGDSIEGSFTIIRNSESRLQIVSDMLASRTMWWYMNDDVFLASTSQRAIIMYLGEFSFNDNVIPWMLSTGTIGPEFSYDKNLKMLSPNTIITLNKNEWMLNVDSKEIKLENKYKTKKEAKKKLHDSLEKTFEKFYLDTNKFVLPLSGGYDSRGILLFLKNKIGLKTITWGKKESREIEENDAFIAKQLADKYNVENIFFDSFNAVIPINIVLNRYLICSEGRIDNIGGYLDGMEMWKSFFEKGYETIIRGEEFLGLYKVKNIFEARINEGLSFLSDYYNIDKKIITSLPEQRLSYKKTKNTYLFKGILAINNEHPIIFGALNDIKLAYAEVFCPLLSSGIINTIKEMYDVEIVGDKKLFKQIVDDLCPDIPIAKEGANKPLERILITQNIREEFFKTFEFAIINKTINEDLVLYARNKINPKRTTAKRKISPKDLLKKILPGFIIEIIKSSVNKREMDWNIFAFRLYIIIKMKLLFEEDCKMRI